jgi:CubicO group peptidase (beta-lactamase class C family)
LTAVRRALPILVALALSAGCSSSEGDTPDSQASATTTAVVEFPGPEWATADPASVGVDQARLADLDQYLDGQGSNCVAVVKDGKLVHETYWNDSTALSEQEIFSATKSITSMLVGIAQGEGLLDINEPASRYITEWQGTPSESVTIRDLLANVSGRYYDVATDYNEMAIKAPDKTGFAIGLSQQFPPETEWEYNNSAIQTLEAVLERATGEDMAEFARTRLFEPIGMQSSIRHDQAGNTLAFMGAQASCQDLARFGYLLMNQGRWGDRQIVPAEYVADATSPSSELNAAYGYLIWLNRPGRIEIPIAGPRDGPLWPAAPPDAFAALGFGRQTVLVIPSEDLIVTRTGPALGGASTGVQSQGNLANEIAQRLLG